MLVNFFIFFFFFFNDTATTEIYTLSLHDALPIYTRSRRRQSRRESLHLYHQRTLGGSLECIDRKSTRLNSSHLVISYAVFCLKKKKNTLHKHKSRNNAINDLTHLRNYDLDDRFSH